MLLRDRRCSPSSSGRGRTSAGAELKERVRAALRPLACRARASSRPRATASASSSSRAAPSDTASGRNVFIVASRGERRVGHHRAQRARSRATDDGRFLVLDKGQRNEQDTSNRREDAVALRDLPRRWPASASSAARERPAAAGAADRRTCCASRPPPNHGELAWRLGLVLAAANMLLLGIGMSASNPRHASNWNLLFALLAFFVYYNLINLTQAWVGAGRLGLGAALARRPRRRASCSRVGLLWWREHGARRRADGAAPARAGAPARRRRRRMRTVRRLFYADIVSAVAFVALAFLALFFFIDFVDELGDIGQRGYTALQRGRLLAAAGPGPSLRADADRGADRHHLRAGPAGADLAVHDPAHRRPRPGPRAGAAGRAWRWSSARSPSSSATTSRRSARRSPASCAPAFAAASSSAAPAPGSRSTRDTPTASAAIRSTSARPTARLGPARRAHLRVRRRRPAASRAPARPRREVASRRHAGRSRTSSVTRWRDAGGRLDRAARSGSPRSTGRARSRRKVVAAAVLPVTTMSTVELWRYIDHLTDNEQAAQLQKIQFWKRALYPFACLVMVGLALPFAYLRHPLRRRQPQGVRRHHARRQLRAAEQRLSPPRPARQLDALDGRRRRPGALYLLLSLAAFSWLVRYR